MTDRSEISELFINNPAYSSSSYESEWFPANIYNAFEYYCVLDDVALIGIEFSTDKISVDKIFSERVIPNTLARISSNSYSLWVRFFVRDMGTPVDLVAPNTPPFSFKAWGYYQKNVLTESNRIHELRAWGDLNSDNYTSVWVSTDKMASLKIQGVHLAVDYSIYLEYSSDGTTLTHTDTIADFATGGVATTGQSTVKDRYVRINLQTHLTSSTRWNVSVFFF